MQTPIVRSSASFLAWNFFFYYPRKISSYFREKKPTIYTPRSSSSPFIQTLRKINVLAPTEMCRVMTRHGSDKGRRWHNYTTVYSPLLSGLRNKPLRIFELGLGTNNPALVSSMGSTGRPGASLRGWREFFPRAAVSGADIDRAILFQEDGIMTFYCDQLDKESIRALWSQPGLCDGVDLLVEDGLHTFDANISFLDGSLDRVRVGGFYVIEDVGLETIGQWRRVLEDYATRFSDFEFALLMLPNPTNGQDNNMIMAHRT
jgi:hypothetical protein